MTLAQRRHPDNGIWLCQKCAKLIDSDVIQYSVALLHRWKTLAEIDAVQRIHGRELDSGSEPNIEFAVTDWRMWRQRGNRPGDVVVVVSGWAPGEIRYSGTLRFRNRGRLEEQLHSVRVQWCCQNAALFSDDYAFQDDITLPPGRWVTAQLCHGLHHSNRSVADRADSIWLFVQRTGDNAPLRWQLTEIEHDDLRETA